MASKDLDNPIEGMMTPPGDESEKTLSLMSGVVGPEGLPEPADLDLTSMKSSSKFFSQGTMLIVILFLVAAGSLYAMRMGQSDLNSGIVAKDVEAKIEQALAKLTKPETLPKGDPLLAANMDLLLNDTNDILIMFENDPTNQQVPLRFVKKNPFVLPIYRKIDEGARPPSELEAELAAKKHLDNLNKELAALDLQSIVQGARPVAIISGEFYQPGQTVGSFTIQSISHLQTVLVSGEHSFTLEMKSKQDKR